MEPKAEQTYLVKENEKDKQHREKELRTLRRRLYVAKLMGWWERVEDLQHQINHLHG